MLKKVGPHSISQAFFGLSANFVELFHFLGEFVVQDEDAISICEALHILRQWNSEWKPPFFMTDFDYKEINAIESGIPF